MSQDTRSDQVKCDRNWKQHVGIAVEMQVLEI